jgi:hypothetical protein
MLRNSRIYLAGCIAVIAMLVTGGWIASDFFRPRQTALTAPQNTNVDGRRIGCAPARRSGKAASRHWRRVRYVLAHGTSPCQGDVRAIGGRKSNAACAAGHPTRGSFSTEIAITGWVGKLRNHPVRLNLNGHMRDK